MPLAADAAFNQTAGLIATFGGIGLLVNGILVYIAVQIMGERRENRENRERRPGADATRV